MSELDDPAQWRSAKDPKSGRTYWYHRVNRISTWVMPPFLVGEIITTPAFTHDHRDANCDDKKTFAGVQIKDEHFCNESGQSSDVQLEAKGTKNIGNEDVDDSNEDLSIILSNAVNSLTGPDEYIRVDALLLLSSRCSVGEEASLQLACTENMMNNIISIITDGYSRSCRQLALKLLCSLAICKKASSIFVQNPSWVLISQKYDSWTGDNESSVLFCIFVGCLYSSTEQVRNLISDKMNKSILMFLSSISENDSQNGVRNGIGAVLGNLETMQLFRFSHSSDFTVDLSSGFSSGSSSTITNDWIFLFHLFSAAELGFKIPGILILMILGTAIGNISEKKNIAESISSTNEVSNLTFGTNDITDVNSKEYANFEDKLHQQIKSNSTDTNLANDMLRNKGGATVLLGLCTGQVVDKVSLSLNCALKRVEYSIVMFFSSDFLTFN